MDTNGKISLKILCPYCGRWVYVNNKHKKDKSECVFENIRLSKQSEKWEEFEIVNAESFSKSNTSMLQSEEGISIIYPRGTSNILDCMFDNQFPTEIGNDEINMIFSCNNNKTLITNAFIKSRKTLSVGNKYFLEIEIIGNKYQEYNKDKGVASQNTKEELGAMKTMEKGSSYKKGFWYVNVKTLTEPILAEKKTKVGESFADIREFYSFLNANYFRQNLLKGMSQKFHINHLSQFFDEVFEKGKWYINLDFPLSLPKLAIENTLLGFGINPKSIRCFDSQIEAFEYRENYLIKMMNIEGFVEDIKSVNKNDEKIWCSRFVKKTKGEKNMAHTEITGGIKIRFEKWDRAVVMQVLEQNINLNSFNNFSNGDMSIKSQNHPTLDDNIVFVRGASKSQDNVIDIKRFSTNEYRDIYYDRVVKLFNDFNDRYKPEPKEESNIFVLS